jgi:hypothetical protein
MKKLVISREPSPESPRSLEESESSVDRSAELVGLQLQDLSIYGEDYRLRDTLDNQSQLAQSHDVHLGRAAQSRDANPSPTSESRMLELASKIYGGIHSWQTRVLTIHAGSFEDPVTCDLTVVDLLAQKGVGVPTSSKVIEYEALSYSWGTVDLKSAVVINDIEYPITQHLWDALKHLRKKDKDRHCWTDALCINQYCNREKSQQVQNMYLIFEKATAVVTWLGLPQGNDISALKALQKLSTVPNPETLKTMHEIGWDGNFTLLREATEKC